MKEETMRLIMMVLWMDFGVFLSACSVSPSASDILSHASHAPLKDLAFTCTGYTASTGTTQLVGKLTTHPYVVDMWSVTNGTSVPSSEQFWTDAWIYRLQQGTWYRSQQISANYFPQHLSYDLLTHPTFVGQETVHGQATYHLQGVLPVENTPGTTTLFEDVWVQQQTSFPVQIQDRNQQFQGAP